MFVVFGLGSDEPVGSANVAMYVMVSMAAYGAVTATTGVAGSAALEQTTGLGPPARAHPAARRWSSWRSRPALAMVVAAVPVALIYAIGAATGASGTAFGLAAVARPSCGLGSALFAVYGLAVCLAFRSDNAVGIASGLIVIMASSATSSPRCRGSSSTSAASPRSTGTPRWPATRSPRAGPPTGAHDPLWLPVANVLAWTVIFAAVALWGLRRGQERV